MDSNYRPRFAIRVERSAEDMENWALLYAERDAPVARQFVSAAMTVGEPLGVKIAEPKMMPVRGGTNLEFGDEIGKAMHEGPPDAVVVIVPDDNGDQYNAIKKDLLGKYGVPNQVVVARTLMDEKKRRPVVTKVVAQIVCKRGGTLWSAPASTKMSGSLVIGYDIFKEKGKPNLVEALVAPLDPQQTHYFSEFHVADNPLQLSQHLVQDTWGAVKFYSHANEGALPKRIIFYRTGIWDGQDDNHDMILHQEVDPLETLLKAKTAGHGIPMAFMVVNQRPNAQFFLRSPHAEGGLDNAPPGTVVDTFVASADGGMSDFNLIPQSACHGTVTPVYFKVLRNTIVEPGFGADFLEALSYKLTHLYYNWPGTIHVPVIMQHATKLATMVGTHLHEETQRNQRRDPYYV